MIKVKNETISEFIKNDIERTLLIYIDKDKMDFSISDFLDNEENQIKFYNILLAYSVIDPELGYTQSTNYIVATLMYTLIDEKNSFWAFYQIMNEFNWRKLYLEKSEYLLKKLEKFNVLLSEKIPNLHNYFEENDVIFIYLLIFF
jgi:hypothetical protein